MIVIYIFNECVDATLVQKVTIERVASVFQNIATVVVGMVIAFASGWKLSLVVVACMPFFVISSIFEVPSFFFDTLSFSFPPFTLANI